MQWLSVLHFITLFNQLLASPVAAFLMQRSLRLAFAVILFMAILRYPVIWLLPETTHVRSLSQISASEESTSPRSHEAESMRPLLSQNIVETARFQSVGAKLRTLLSYNTVIFCFTCFFVKRIAFTSEILMFQYTSEYFGQSLDKTAWIRLPIGLGAILVTGFCLPALFQSLGKKRKQGHELKWEMRAARASLAILMTGFGLYWVAFNLPMMVVGKNATAIAAKVC